MLAVPSQHAPSPFLAADQGGIEWGGAPLSTDSILSALNFRERASHLPQY